MASTASCGYCGRQITSQADQAQVCPEHQWLYPRILLKASITPGHYGLKLREGTYLEFESATFLGKWVLLSPSQRASGFGPHLPEPFSKGMEVRLSDIVWAADST